MTPNTKTCTKCLKMKSVEEFSKNAQAKDGRQTRCKGCFSEYYAANRAKQLAQNKQWREENREQRLAYHAQWKVDNADRIEEYNSRPEVYKATLKRSREWKAANPDWRRADNARRRARWTGVPHEQVDLAVLRERDTACYLCGVSFQPEDVLHLDHKIPLARPELGPSHTYENCALVHASCNLSKRDKTPDEYWNVA